MLRAITLVLDLEDWELATIVPSSTVRVEIYNSDHRGIVATAEIRNVKDLRIGQNGPAVQPSALKED